MFRQHYELNLFFVRSSQLVKQWKKIWLRLFRLIGCMIGAINAVTELKYILDISFNKNVKESSNMILNRVV